MSKDDLRNVLLITAIVIGGAFLVAFVVDLL